MSRFNNLLARRLRALRGRTRLTQREVAFALGVFRESVAEIEAGRRAVTLLEGHSMAKLYGFTLDELMAGIGSARRVPGQRASRLRPERP